MVLEFSNDELRVLSNVLISFKDNGLHHILSCSDLVLLTNVVHRISDFWDNLD